MLLWKLWSILNRSRPINCKIFYAIKHTYQFPHIYKLTISLYEIILTIQRFRVYKAPYKKADSIRCVLLRVSKEKHRG